MVKPCGLKINNGKLYLNGHLLTDLKKEYKTPLYVLDETQLDQNFIDYNSSFKSANFDTHLVYASKALLVPYLLDKCQEHNFFVDSVSLGDLYLINHSHYPMEKVIFHGNNKSLEELIYATNNHVGIIVVDNVFELKKLISLDIKQQIMIRINPNIDAHTHEYISTAKQDSKFGTNILDINTIDEMISLIKNSKLELLGFHAHIGSSIKDASPFIKEIETMILFQNKINEDYHLSLNHLNLGGGFGIDYEESDNVLSNKEMMSLIIKKIEDTIKNTKSKISHFYIEPGRSIVGNAGITLYNISQIKKTLTKDYLFIDGGMTDNIRPALYQAKYSVDVCEHCELEKNHKVDIVGKCCESGDFICRDTYITEVNENDTLVVYSTGAYNYSMFVSYNGMLKPALISVGKDIKVISKREDLEVLLRTF